MISLKIARGHEFIVLCDYSSGDQGAFLLDRRSPRDSLSWLSGDVRPVPVVADELSRVIDLLEATTPYVRPRQ